MNCEIVKKLKDADYPLIEIKDGMNCSNREHVDLCPNFDATKGDSFDQKCHFMEPTLEELMDECGENVIRRIEKIELTHEGKLLEDSLAEEDKIWIAESLNFSICGFGKTPTEAVANLWLNLTKKT